ncbi:50S ribosomal protein L22 [Candidatus Parcubacteria bacterium]|nr:MAG: 50S ribosomal protein L22 [Candidatus Parcubacteria bacterium]
MEYKAISKNIKMSPRKVRLVVDSIKKRDVPAALYFLSHMSRRAAIPVKKTLESALANAVNNFKAKKEELVLKNILVEEGISYKRHRYAGRGRVRPYKKRTSHIRVILEERKENYGAKS